MSGRRSMALVRRCAPNFRAKVAGMAPSKKNQRCPPWPERERSRAAGRFLWRQVSRNAAASSCHAALQIVVRASRPLSRGYSFASLRTSSARVRERDAPATAGETPAPHPAAVGGFSWFLGACQWTGVNDCLVKIGSQEESEVLVCGKHRAAGDLRAGAGNGCPGAAAGAAPERARIRR